MDFYFLNYYQQQNIGQPEYRISEAGKRLGSNKLTLDMSTFQKPLQIFHFAYSFSY